MDTGILSAGIGISLGILLGKIGAHYLGKLLWYIEIKGWRYHDS
jgi:hypothetical protein